MHSTDPAGTARRRIVVIAVAAGILAAAAAGACSLTDTKRDPCTADEQCAAAFGAGSRCASGYCTEPGSASSSSGTTGCSGTGPDGKPCSCKPMTTPDFENACTSVMCVPFDDGMRVTKLLPDGGLPPLPP